VDRQECLWLFERLAADSPSRLRALLGTLAVVPASRGGRPLLLHRSCVLGWTVAEAAKAFGQQRDTPKLLASSATRELSYGSSLPRFLGLQAIRRPIHASTQREQVCSGTHSLALCACIGQVPSRGSPYRFRSSLPSVHKQLSLGALAFVRVRRLFRNTPPWNCAL
jgi:hypothetical protein